MTRRRRVPVVIGSGENGTLPLDWDIQTAMVHNGRHVEVGTELSIKGERGRFRFMKVVRRPNGVEWIDVWGGPRKAEQWRSFRPSRIRTVHYKNRTPKNLLADRKAAAS